VPGGGCGSLAAGAWFAGFGCAGGQVRPGAWVAELTGLLDLGGWPEGMRVIVRKERPHSGAQLRFTDIDGHRFTAFATDARRGQLADLEQRHRRRARCEDRIRNAKDTGLRNLPLHGFDQNQIWCELVAMASELLAWMQLLALDGPARAWEPKRLRLFSVAGRLVRGGRRLRLRLAATWPWAGQLTTAITRLQASRLGNYHQTAPATRKDKPRARRSPPTRRDSRKARHSQALKISKWPQSQPRSSRSRNIEVKAARFALSSQVGAPGLLDVMSN
jgi:hypothetical protein